MKKIFWLICIVVLTLSALPASAQSGGELEPRVAELEKLTEKLLLTLSGTEATVDPTLIHHMHEIVPTTVGYMQLTEAFVSRDSILRLSVKLTNTTDEPVEFDYSNLRVRNGDGTLLEYEYDCPRLFDLLVLPGEAVQGNACFKYEGPLPLRVYYGVNPYLANLVTWEIGE